MAFLTCNFKSHVLGMQTTFDAIIPEDSSGPFRTVYLLHGLTDDHTAWTRHSNVERYALSRNLAVILPDAARSFYTDMAYGGKYYTFISDELFRYTRSLFNLSKSRDDTFIAGLSMGGHGAYKIALKNPDKFSAAASLSGLLTIDLFTEDKNPEMLREIKMLLGDEPIKTKPLENPIDIFLSAAKTGKTLPRLYQACGTEDFLYTPNIMFKKAASQYDFDYKYEEAPGSHTWDFWDKYIQNAFDFFIKK